MDTGQSSLHPFVRLSREQWARLPADSSFALSEDAYFHRFAELSVEDARAVAIRIWDEIDHPNLKENIEPTKDRARLILEKGHDHSVQSVRLRRI